MKYLDANVFIYLALSPSSETKVVHAKNLLEAVIEGNTEAATSSLTWDELVWAVKKIAGIGAAKAEGKKFIMLPKLKILNVNEETLNVAQWVIDNHRIAPRDAIHAACCIENGITEIVSDDTDFDVVKLLKRIPIEKVKYS